MTAAIGTGSSALYQDSFDQSSVPLSSKFGCQIFKTALGLDASVKKMALTQGFDAEIAEFCNDQKVDYVSVTGKINSNEDLRLLKGFKVIVFFCPSIRVLQGILSENKQTEWLTCYADPLIRISDVEELATLLESATSLKSICLNHCFLFEPEAYERMLEVKKRRPCLQLSIACTDGRRETFHSSSTASQKRLSSSSVL